MARKRKPLDSCPVCLAVDTRSLAGEPLDLLGVPVMFRTCVNCGAETSTRLPAALLAAAQLVAREAPR